MDSAESLDFTEQNDAERTSANDDSFEEQETLETSAESEETAEIIDMSEYLDNAADHVVAEATHEEEAQSARLEGLSLDEELSQEAEVIKLDFHQQMGEIAEDIQEIDPLDPDHIEVEEIPEENIEAPATPDVEAAQNRKENLQEIATAKRFEEFGVTAEDLASIEGYEDLSAGQQLLVAENLKQLTVVDMERGAESRFTQMQTEISQDASTGKILKAFKLVGSQLRRGSHMKQFGQEEMTETMSAGMKQHGETLQTLVEATKNGPGVEQMEDGSLEIQYASGFENVTLEQQENIDSFNKVANEFSRVPLEWKYAREGSKEHKEYVAAEKQFEDSKDLVQNIRGTQENREAALRLEAQIKEGVEWNQQLNSNKDVEAAIVKLQDGEKWTEALQRQYKERGVLMATGFVTRHALTGLMGVAAFPAAVATAGVMGGIRGAKKGRENIDERNALERRGEQKEGMESRNVNDVKDLGAKAELLVNKINDTEDPDERAALLTKLERRINFNEGKVDIGKQVVNNLGDLSRYNNNMCEARALLVAEPYIGKNSKADERIANKLNLYDEQISEQDRKVIIESVKNGAKKGLKYGLIGATIAEAFSSVDAEAAEIDMSVAPEAAVAETVSENSNVEDLTSSVEEATGAAVEAPQSAIEKPGIDSPIEDLNGSLAEQEIPVEAGLEFSQHEVAPGDTVWKFIKADLGENASNTDIANAVAKLEGLSDEQLHEIGFRAHPKTGEYSVDLIRPGESIDLSKLNETMDSSPATVETPTVETTTQVPEETYEEPEEIIVDEPQEKIEVSETGSETTEVQKEELSPKEKELNRIATTAEGRKEFIDNAMEKMRAKNPNRSARFELAYRRGINTEWIKVRDAVLAHEMGIDDIDGDGFIPLSQQSRTIGELKTPIPDDIYEKFFKDPFKRDPSTSFENKGSVTASPDYGDFDDFDDESSATEGPAATPETNTEIREPGPQKVAAETIEPAKLSYAEQYRIDHDAFGSEMAEIKTKHGGDFNAKLHELLGDLDARALDRDWSGEGGLGNYAMQDFSERQFVHGSHNVSVGGQDEQFRQNIANFLKENEDVLPKNGEPGFQDLSAWESLEDRIYRILDAKSETTGASEAIQVETPTKEEMIPEGDVAESFEASTSDAVEKVRAAEGPLTPEEEAFLNDRIAQYTKQIEASMDNPPSSEIEANRLENLAGQKAAEDLRGMRAEAEITIDARSERIGDVPLETQGGPEIARSEYYGRLEVEHGKELEELMKEIFIDRNRSGERTADRIAQNMGGRGRGGRMLGDLLGRATGLGTTNNMSDWRDIAETDASTFENSAREFSRDRNTERLDRSNMRDLMRLFSDMKIDPLPGENLKEFFLRGLDK